MAQANRIARARAHTSWRLRRCASGEMRMLAPVGPRVVTPAARRTVPVIIYVFLRMALTLAQPRGRAERNRAGGSLALRPCWRAVESVDRQTRDECPARSAARAALTRGSLRRFGAPGLLHVRKKSRGPALRVTPTALLRVDTATAHQQDDVRPAGTASPIHESSLAPAWRGQGTRRPYTTPSSVSCCRITDNMDRRDSPSSYRALPPARPKFPQL